MKALVISDTHGNLDLVEAAGRRAVEVGAGLALHLGDDLEDAEPLRRLGLEVRGVQGVYHPDYRQPETPNRLLVRLERLPLLLTHCRLPHANDLPEDGDPAEVARRLGAWVVLYGHTHEPAIKEESGLLWINPGHLKPEDKKGWPPTLAWLEVSGSSLAVQIEDLRSGTVFFRWPEKG